MRSDTLARFLYAATFVYLGLPYVLFFGGWIRQPYSTLLCLGLVAGALAGLKLLARHIAAADESQFYPSKDLLLLLLPALAVGLICGFGGWGTQDKDWLKHNAILLDLVSQDWPVVYGGAKDAAMLTYYTAFQLPAGLAGKLLGWEGANHVLFLYTLVGLCLAMLWIKLLTEARSWWFILVFLAFSGMDIVGQIIFSFEKQSSLAAAMEVLVGRLTGWEHMEWWVGWGFAQYSSMASLLTLVPNQGITGWLVTSMVLHNAKLKCLHITGLFYLTLCGLWTPFVGLGLVPFIGVILLYLWQQSQWDRGFLRQAVSWTNLTGLVLGCIVVFYLAGRFQPYAMPVDVSGLYKEQITLTFLREPFVNGPRMFVIRFLLFVLLEFVVLHGLLYWYIKLQDKGQFTVWRNLLILSSAILFFLPLLNWGWNNEPSMRSSIPPIFATALVTILVLGDRALSDRAQWIKRAIVALLLVGCCTGIIEYGRHLHGVGQRGALVAVPAEEEVENLFELQTSSYSYYNFAGQYLGSSDSYFMRYLGKQ